MMLELTVNVMFHTDETREAETIGKPLPFSKYDRREFTFYSIDHVHPIYDEDDNDKEYTELWSGGDRFIIDLTAEETRCLIRQQRIAVYLS